MLRGRGSGGGIWDFWGWSFRNVPPGLCGSGGDCGLEGVWPESARGGLRVSLLASDCYEMNLLLCPRVGTEVLILLLSIVRFSSRLKSIKAGGI